MSTIHTHGRRPEPLGMPLDNTVLTNGPYPKAVIAYLWQCGRPGCLMMHPTHQEAARHANGSITFPSDRIQ